MPYILSERRLLFKDIGMEGLSCKNPDELCNKLFDYCKKFIINNTLCDNATVGDLNYCLSMICKGYLNKLGLIKYKTIDEIIYAIKCLQRFIEKDEIFDSIIGTIECVKLEFYRKVAAPYENLKESENGSVY